ncbi:MAG: glycosyltransferase [Acidimicrobiales bacterium]
MADIRVGIVSWNTAELLDRCLAALPAALGDLDAEVVVVDNASSDASAAVARGHDNVTVVANAANEGYARAMNQALAATDAPVLIALNPDTEPPPGSLAELARRLLGNPRAGLVVPRLVNVDGSPQPSAQRFPSLGLAVVSGFLPLPWQRGRLGRRWWLPPAPQPERTVAVDWAIGAVHVIRAEATAGRDPYSERWFMYVEDLELCWRLHQQEWAVVLEAAVAIPHVGNASGAQAWGWTRARRYWAATYDFDSQARSRAHARAWAAVNLAATAAHLAANQLRRARPSERRQSHSDAAGELRALLPVHLRAMLHGPPPPS